MVDVLELPHDAAVLDLAAGTGKLTRVLVERYQRVVAVEPLDEMRAVLERAVPAAEVRTGRAEAIPAADGEFDAVFVAQAFHWFATDQIVAELARVMRPGAQLVSRSMPRSSGRGASDREASVSRRKPLTWSLT